MRWPVPFLSCILMLAPIARATGPDVIVGLLYDPHRWARDAGAGITAFSVGTTSCNIGDAVLQWNSDTNQHPVIIQNMYRLKNGRFEQIGLAWVKHGFATLNQSLCQLCQDPNNNQVLGVGCSDPYSSGLNGQQDLLGPRSQINAATGVFPYPFTAPQWTTAIDRRLQVHDADLIPAQNVGALYFLEGQYVTADDAAAGNDNNNNSYQQISITETPPGSFNFVPSLGTWSTVQQKAAVQAWQDNDPTVTITFIDVPGDGRFILGAKVTQLMLPAPPMTPTHPTGFWRYEYALQNINSDRSAQSFSVLFDAHAPRVNVGFHDVDYHSGEPYSGTDWTTSGPITWSTQTYAVNQNANALRFATLYNFRFDTTCPPSNTASLSIGLFKPGSPSSVSFNALGPTPTAVDCNHNGTPDWLEIQGNPALDCDHNGNLDSCDFDCNANGIPDACEIAADPSKDCNGNGILDVCELPVGDPAPGGPFYCTGGCLLDCNHNGKPDGCDIASSFDPDCNGNGIPDSCDIASGFSTDCNGNGVPDSCEIAANPALDCNTNGVIDSCGEIDCNGNNIPDDCEEPSCPGILAGDVNCSGAITLADIPGFVTYVLAGKPSCLADMNHDGKVNGLDVILFTHALAP